MTTKDFPFTEVVQQASQYIEAGHTVHQKFTCRRCGSRQTMDVPNKFFLAGKCEECGAVTDIQARGCNYVLVTGANKGFFAETIPVKGDRQWLRSSIRPASCRFRR